MILNPYGISMNIQLDITGFTRFNNAATCTSSLNASGVATLNHTTTCFSSFNVKREQ